MHESIGGNQWSREHSHLKQFNCKLFVDQTLDGPVKLAKNLVPLSQAGDTCILLNNVDHMFDHVYVNVVGPWLRSYPAFASSSEHEHTFFLWAGPFAQCVICCAVACVPWSYIYA